MIRQTHTYAILEVDETTYADVRARLAAVGYEHTFHEERKHGEVIDMHGIALAAVTMASQNETEPPHAGDS